MFAARGSCWDYCRVGARSSDRVRFDGRDGSVPPELATYGILPRAPNSHRALDLLPILSTIASVLRALAVVLVIIGLAGIVLPALPGTVLIFAGLWLAAWADGFTRVSEGTIIMLGLVAAATYLVDVVMMALGMKRLGTSRRAMAGAALGTVAGLFFGLPGLIVGPFAGAVIGELTAHGDLRRAGRAGIAAWIGFAIGTVVKVGFAFVMIGIFLAAWFAF